MNATNQSTSPSSLPAGTQAAATRASKRQRLKLIAYWVTTLLGPASFVIGGTLFLTHGEQQVAALSHLGYPPYLLDILGFWKLAGAITVVVPGLPRLKEWAYAGFFFDLTGAAASHAFAGDGAGEILAPLLFLALVVASWALRPASRRLQGQDERPKRGGRDVVT